MTRATAAERELVEGIARALAAHYGRALAVQDRLDSLDGRSGALASEELRADPQAARAVAGELVAGLLRVAADERLVSVLGEAARPSTVRAIAERLGLSRLAVARRVGELAGAGLVERDPGTDQVAQSPLGAALGALLDELAERTASAVAEAGR
jgi:hypothetical protein